MICDYRKKKVWDVSCKTLVDRHYDSACHFANCNDSCGMGPDKNYTSVLSGFIFILGRSTCMGFTQNVF